MYLSVWRPFHHTKLHAYMLSSLIKRNVGGGVLTLASLWLCYPRPHYSSVTPGLAIALLPQASLWLCYPARPHYSSVTPGLTIALLPQASLWFCYPRPRYGSVTPAWPHYSSVTPGLTTLPVCVTEILMYCLIEPLISSFSCI